MKHKEIERLIQKSLDRETSAEEEKSLHLHLSRCPDCQQFYQELVQTGQAMNTLIEFFPQYGFNDRVLKKIGFRRAFAWSKAAAVFAGIWLTSFLFIIFSPLPNEILSRALTSTPALIRLFDKIELVISSLSHTLLPFVKSSLNSSLLIAGLIFSIFLIYFFSKAISPVRKLGKQNKPRPKGRVF